MCFFGTEQLWDWVGQKLLPTFNVFFVQMTSGGKSAMFTCPISLRQFAVLHLVGLFHEIGNTSGAYKFRITLSTNIGWWIVLWMSMK